MPPDNDLCSPTPLTDHIIVKPSLKDVNSASSFARRKAGTCKVMVNLLRSAIYTTLKAKRWRNHLKITHLVNFQVRGSNSTLTSQMTNQTCSSGSANCWTLNLNAVSSSVQFRFGPISKPNFPSTTLRLKNCVVYFTPTSCIVEHIFVHVHDI